MRMMMILSRDEIAATVAVQAISAGLSLEGHQRDLEEIVARYDEILRADPVVEEVKVLDNGDVAYTMQTTQRNETVAGLIKAIDAYTEDPDVGTSLAQAMINPVIAQGAIQMALNVTGITW